MVVLAMVFPACSALIFAGWAEMIAAGWWPAGALMGGIFGLALLLGDG